MKKKWITFGVFIISVGTFYCVEQQQSTELSSLALENIEALAQDEQGGEDRGCLVLYCGTCTWISGTKTTFSGISYC